MWRRPFEALIQLMVDNLYRQLFVDDVEGRVIKKVAQVRPLAGGGASR